MGSVSRSFFNAGDCMSSLSPAFGGFLLGVGVSAELRGTLIGFQGTNDTETFHLIENNNVVFYRLSGISKYIHLNIVVPYRYIRAITIGKNEGVELAYQTTTNDIAFYFKE